MIPSLKSKKYLRIFTFQYGSIQMIPSLKSKKYLRIFTFQYGSIQIPLTKIITDICINLHSNMVLFKSFNDFAYNYVSRIYIPIWFYSN